MVSSENGEEQAFDIELPDAEPDALAETKIDAGKLPGGIVEAFIATSLLDVRPLMWDMMNEHTTTRAKIDKHKMVRLFVKIKPWADPITIRVYLLSWQVENG